jgi:hypothetical protein
MDGVISEARFGGRRLLRCADTNRLILKDIDDSAYEHVGVMPAVIDLMKKIVCEDRLRVLTAVENGVEVLQKEALLRRLGFNNVEKWLICTTNREQKFLVLEKLRSEWDTVVYVDDSLDVLLEFEERAIEETMSNLEFFHVSSIYAEDVPK